MIQNNISAIAIILVAVCVLLVVFIIFLFWRIRRLEGDYELLTRGTQGKNFVEIVNENIVQTERLLEEVDRLSGMYAFVLRRIAGSVQHVGVVRFDAFRDLGGLLSFAVALLDDRGNGLIMSSIYGRSESRTYAKPIVERGSMYELSPEEKEAIRLAMQSKEMGALPVEARDLDHEEKIATLKLFHEKDYMEARREQEVRAQRRPVPREEPRPRPVAAEPPQTRHRTRKERPRPVERPVKGSRGGAAEPVSGGTAELTVDGTAERPGDEGRSKRARERTEERPPPRRPDLRPRGLNTPAERLRDREPGGK